MKRDEDSRVGSYLRQVDRLATANFGLPFTAVQSDVEEAAGIQVVSEMNGGLSPEGFVGLLERTFPMRRVGQDAAPSETASANRGMLALATYARLSDDWGIGPDGAAYRERDGGIDRLAYAPDRSGTANGFLCSRADGAELGASAGGRLAPTAGTAFYDIAGALDIGDAVEAFENALEIGHKGPGL